MSTDAIVLLKADHKEVARLFAEFEKRATTPARKRAIVGKVLEALTVHTYLENEVLYPQVRAEVPALEDHILESYEEHHVVDVLAAELAGRCETIVVVVVDAAQIDAVFNDQGLPNLGYANDLLYQAAAQVIASRVATMRSAVTGR